MNWRICLWGSFVVVLSLIVADIVKAEDQVQTKLTESEKIALKQLHTRKNIDKQIWQYNHSSSKWICTHKLQAPKGIITFEDQLGFFSLLEKLEQPNLIFIESSLINTPYLVRRVQAENAEISLHESWMSFENPKFQRYSFNDLPVDLSYKFDHVKPNLQGNAQNFKIDFKQQPPKITGQGVKIKMGTNS